MLRMLRGRALAIAILLGGGAAWLALPAPVSAHTSVMVGEFEFEVGWRAEPPLVGELNGLDLGIHRHPSGVPVEGAEGNLTATLRTGPASVVEALAPQAGRPGWYTFDVVPTREGDYTVQILGTLDGTAVDITVTLETIIGRATVEFPVNDPSTSDLQEAFADETAALRAQGSTLSIIAILAVIVGAVGVAIAGLAFWRMRTGP